MRASCNSVRAPGACSSEFGEDFLLRDKSISTRKCDPLPYQRALDKETNLRLISNPFLPAQEDRFSELVSFLKNSSTPTPFYPAQEDRFSELVPFLKNNSKEQVLRNDLLEQEKRGLESNLLHMEGHQRLEAKILDKEINLRLDSNPLLSCSRRSFLRACSFS